MIALIDADVLAYRIGFACEKTMYVVDIGDDIEVEFRTAKEAKSNGEVVRTYVDAMSPAFAEELLLNTIDKIVTDTKSDSYKLYLTDSKSNFRNEVAKYVPYKGNRSGRKPVHFDFLRNYMIDKLGAVVVVGQEADDEMSMTQCHGDKCGVATVICSIDKDLWQVPGYHYDISTTKIIKATLLGKLVLKKKLIGTGFAWFCAQMLLGDAVDNIKGINGIGSVKAYKLLLPKVGSVKLLWRRVKAIYKTHGQLNRIEENAILLWMRREKDQHPYEWIERYCK